MLGITYSSLVLAVVVEVSYLRAPTYQSTPARTSTSNPSPIRHRGSASPRPVSPLSSRSRGPAARRCSDGPLPTASAPPAARMTAPTARTTGQTSTRPWDWPDPPWATTTGRAPLSSACAWTRGWHRESQSGLQSPAGQGEGGVRHGEKWRNKGPERLDYNAIIQPHCGKCYMTISKHIQIWFSIRYRKIWKI